MPDENEVPSIDELFRRQPEGLPYTPEERKQVIAWYREKATLFFSGQKVKGTKPSGPVDTSQMMDV